MKSKRFITRWKRGSSENRGTNGMMNDENMKMNMDEMENKKDGMK
jgi:hypothetical protein